MTVRELRQLLFDIKDQDAEVAIATEVRHGVVVGTKSVAEVKPGPNGFITICLK